MNFKLKKIYIYEKNKTKYLKLPLAIVEEYPLSIKIQNKIYLVTLRTPGDEKAHAIGLCFSEGIINNPQDIKIIGLYNKNKSNIINIFLRKSRIYKILNKLKKNYNLYKKIKSNLYNNVNKTLDNLKVNKSDIIKKILKFHLYQPLREKTNATHCAIIYDKNLKILASSEDIGRHNTIDKTIGKIFLNKKIHKGKIITLSSRISYDLILKIARAQIPIVVAISRPSSLAIKLALKLNITLTSLSPNNGLIIYTKKHRINNI